jgi:hypothetical protein
VISSPAEEVSYKPSSAENNMIADNFTKAWKGLSTEKLKVLFPFILLHKPTFLQEYQIRINIKKTEAKVVTKLATVM